MEESLLLPLVAVLNESDLYSTWMPKWKVPRVGVLHSHKLAELGRGHQIIDVLCQLPLPLANRQCLQHAFAVDSIDEDQAIIIKVETLDEYPGVDIPAKASNVVRIDLEAGILIRACPPDHPALKESRHLYPEGESLLLVSVVQEIDPQVAYMPKRLVNFMTRTVLGTLWGRLLRVAEQVRDGELVEHRTAMKENQILYDWLQQRIGVLLERVKEKQ